MNVLMVLLLLWMGVGEPTDVADQLETVVHEQIADPVQRWRPLVEEHFPAEEVDTALCIIGHESGGNPLADNPQSSASGLFQVLGSLWAPRFGVARDQLFEPELNTRLASDIWEQQGWWAWSPYQRGACR